ncbi:MAG: HAD family hydrolase [Dehalococcoidia bacterium]|nr:HAD family hydrolase [Dehalococcoidia bacterium]MDP6228356.1 HAD family hydrolase [Dehalococcoidia bacterium]MDP7082921.1 HAD family hydrolase [Dehalococcoidia bacterium]MDP7201149.1 HAD family hydrolase [Dehalococcoidia bacterium]MDP7510386.1 HAD family hydrolase [Dehalococcoidia bacterium]
MVILISFDIDGTLEVGDPPGILTMEMVRRAKEKGYLIGSCSDRPLSAQRVIWDQHNIPVEFVSSKHQLPEVKAKFEADIYYHIGDREDLDKKPALEAGFEFLWPEEAAEKAWFLSDADPGLASG